MISLRRTAPETRLALPTSGGLSRLSGVPVLGGVMLACLLAAPASSQRVLPANGLQAGDSPLASSSIQNMQSYTVVAKLSVELPSQTRFTLRGTLPIEKGKFPRADGMLPYGIVGPDGQGFPAQIEIVSHYPSTSDGADVIEILARVSKPINQQSGRAEYKVVEYLHPNRGLRATDTITALYGTPGSIVLESRDVFGNPYAIDVLQDWDGLRIMRDGRAAATYRYYGTLRPTGPNMGPPTGSLTHLMGVHSYVTAWAEEDLLTIDLRVSNGSSGIAASPYNDPQADLYFKDLNLRVPSGWTVLQLFSDPNFGPSQNQGGSVLHPIVKALPGGDMHVLPQLFQFERRLAVTPTNKVARALSVLRSEGFAVCVDDFNAQGDRLYSWWNPETARYFPQNTRLPKIDWIPENTLSGWMSSKLNEYTNILANGIDLNDYPIYSKDMGWAHPWGTPYGGMTGSAEIYPLDGVKTAFTGSLDGYHFVQIQHRMYTDRQSIAFYNLNGDPSTLEDWVKPNPIPHLPMSHSNVLTGSDDIPGWGNAPSFQVEYVNAQGLKPPYESELRNYDSIDQQHYIRYSRNPKVLSWLGNDPMAKDDLELSAESMRLRYTEYPTSPTGYIAPGSMLNQQNWVTSNPGIGFGFGRGPAWSVDTVNAAYATGSFAFRARSRAWLNSALDLIEAGQSTCSGTIQRIHSNALLSGNYNVRQAYEESLIEQSVLGMHGAVFEDAFPGKAQRAEAILTQSANALFTGSSWNTSANAPFYTLAVDDLSTSGPGFCGAVPSDGYSSAVDKTQMYAALEAGYRLTGNNLYIVKTAQLMGANNNTPASALAEFHQTYFTGLEQRSPMIAALQLLLE